MNQYQALGYFSPQGAPLPVGLPLRKWPEEALQPGTICSVVSGSWSGCSGRMADFDLATDTVSLLLEGEPVARVFPAAMTLPAWIAEMWWL